MTQSGRPDRQGDPVERPDPVLRAKYLDYCSARVADLLVQLTADEMYLLAQDAARELRVENDESLSYLEIVRLATDRISRKLALPDLDTWVETYQEDPERFERELLGLWKSDFEASSHGAT